MDGDGDKILDTFLDIVRKSNTTVANELKEHRELLTQNLIDHEKINARLDVIDSNTNGSRKYAFLGGLAVMAIPAILITISIISDFFK